MGIEYHELNPTESIVLIDSKEFTLRPFDLSAQVWAYNYFATKDNKDGVSVLANRLTDMNDADAIMRVTWFLLKRKVYFGSYDNFLKKIDLDEDGKWNVIVRLYTAVVQSLGVSQPKMEEIKEELELKKSMAVGR